MYIRPLFCVILRVWHVISMSFCGPSSRQFPAPRLMKTALRVKSGFEHSLFGKYAHLLSLTSRQWTAGNVSVSMQLADRIYWSSLIEQLLGKCYGLKLRGKKYNHLNIITQNSWRRRKTQTDVDTNDNPLFADKWDQSALHSYAAC